MGQAALVLVLEEEPPTTGFDEDESLEFDDVDELRGGRAGAESPEDDEEADESDLAATVLLPSCGCRCGRSLSP